MDLKALRLKNVNKLIIAHLNINSLKNKFEFLISLIKDNIDVLVISKTKLDESFPTSQFMINGFSAPFRLDRNDKGGGIILYIRDDIPSRLVSTESSQVEGFFVEINLRNKKRWLLCCSYNPKKDLIRQHLYALSKSIDVFTSKYDDLLFLDDFNVGVEDTSVKNFCRSYNLTSMINKPTCYKNPDRSSCIDLILTNCPRSFQNSCVIETGLSDFHKMVVTVMKTTYRKLEPGTVYYRDFKYFCNNSFKESLQKCISQNLGVACDEIYESFVAPGNNVLDNHAPPLKRSMREAIIRLS